MAVTVTSASFQTLSGSCPCLSRLGRICSNFRPWHPRHLYVYLFLWFPATPSYCPTCPLGHAALGFECTGGPGCGSIPCSTNRLAAARARSRALHMLSVLHMRSVSRVPHACRLVLSVCSTLRRGPPRRVGPRTPQCLRSSLHLGWEAAFLLSSVCRSCCPAWGGRAGWCERGLVVRAVGSRRCSRAGAIERFAFVCAVATAAVFSARRVAVLCKRAEVTLNLAMASPGAFLILPTLPLLLGGRAVSGDEVASNLAMASPRP